MERRESSDWHFFFFQAEDGIRDSPVTGVQTCALPIFDWGFFNTILVCYNNHWILKTTPEDWWSIIVGTVATAVDQKSELPSIRKFFVSHEGKKV